MLPLPLLPLLAVLLLLLLLPLVPLLVTVQALDQEVRIGSRA